MNFQKITWKFYLNLNLWTISMLIKCSKLLCYLAWAFISRKMRSSCGKYVMDVAIYFRLRTIVIGDIWRFSMIPNWSKMSMSDHLNHKGSIWYYSEPLEIPYCLNQYLDRYFFATFYRKVALVEKEISNICLQVQIIWTDPNQFGPFLNHWTYRKKRHKFYVFWQDFHWF